MQLKKESNLSTIIIILIIGGVLVYALYPMLTSKIKSIQVESDRLVTNMETADDLEIAAKEYYNDMKYINDLSEFDGRTNILDKLDISTGIPESGVVYMNENEEVYIRVVYDDMCYIKGFDEQYSTVKDLNYCND